VPIFSTPEAWSWASAGFVLVADGVAGWAEGAAVLAQAVRAKDAGDDGGDGGQEALESHWFPTFWW